ncbi:MAG: hypothetical protein U5K30_13450 [Acidimicrobiales bacterium]|nr:hypothetical protein [Acidimicrobiales bacterium]
MERFLADLGVEATVVPIAAEDPFVGVDDLVGGGRVDNGYDLVWCLGGRSPTAVNLALSHDLALLCSRELDRAVVEAAEDALTGMSEIHRSVLDVQVDGARRFVPGSVEVGPGTLHLELTQRVDTTTTTIDSPVRVMAELPATGRLSVGFDAGPRLMADQVTITSNAPTRMSVDGGREQLVEYLRIAVLDRPLRELVLGAGARQGSVADLPAR